MKNQTVRSLAMWVFVFVFGVVTLALANNGGKKEKEVKIKTSAKCEMCKERIEKNLSLSKGVTSASLDLETNVVTVKFKTKKTDETKIKKVITDTGYDADELTCDKAAHDKLPGCCQKSSAAHSDKH